MKSKSKYYFLLLYGLCIFLVFNRHSKSKFNNYHSINWADAAGYYVYLPATFIYHYNTDEFPKGITSTTGDGFTLDSTNNIVFTRYNYGVALLQSPFFLTAHLVAPLFNQPRDGYNKIYYRSIMIAAVTYLLLGLYFCKRWLENYFNENTSLMSVFLIFVCTNLYYYAINSGGFSHVYSFFLMSVFLFLTHKFYNSSFSKQTLLVLSLILSVLTLIRLTNFLMIIIWFGYGITSTENLRDRISLWLKKSRYLFYFPLAGLIIFVPQFIYWNYTSGSLLLYAYGNQGFTNLLSPHILEILFSPNNGWLIHSPVIVFAFIGIYAMKKHQPFFAMLILSLLLLLTYIFASWWSWTFGCGYGSRSYVEWYAVLLLPFSYCINAILTNFSRVISKFALVFIMLFIYLNLNTIYHYDDCWYGDTWDFNEYRKIILNFK